MELIRYFASTDVNIYILSKGELEDKKKLSDEGYTCIDIGSVVLNPLKAILYFYKLSYQLYNIQPSIIFSFTIRPNLFGSIAAAILKLPIVSNVTGTGPLSYDQSILYRIIRGIYTFAFRSNQRVFFQNSDDMGYFLEKQFVSKKQAKLLPGSGVDVDYYAPRPRVEVEGFKFLLISRLIRDKGVMEYIHAANIVKQKYPSIQFQILGPFWTQSTSKNTISKEEIESWVQRGVIDYLGYTLDVRPYIAEVDCVVLASYREGCANVLMQAASMAKPLIASDVTGCRNLVDDNQSGLLCEVRNAEDLAEKMEKIYLLFSTERFEMGSRGREKMEKEYQKSIVLTAYKEELDMVYSMNIA